MQHLPGSGNGVSMTHCGRPPENTGRPHYMADWLPVAQVIELSWYEGGDLETPVQTVRVPIRHALQFE